MTDMVKIKLNGKWDMVLPKHRADRPEWTTGWETETLNAFEKNVHHDDIVYEIGAEEGDMSALLAEWCNGRIFLFEPNPRVWPNIKAIWEANHLPIPLGWFVGFAGSVDNLKPEHLNFQADNPIVRRGDSLQYWPDCAYGDVIGDHGFRHLAEEADSTPQITIDTFVEKNIGHPPTVLTIDIEGAEFEALKGAKKTLEKYKPMIFLSIHPEFMNHHFGQFEKELHNYLEDMGYKWKHLAYDHEHHYVFWNRDGKQYVD